MITSRAASAAQDRDLVAPARPLAVSGICRALAPAHQRPVAAHAPAAIAPGDLMGRRERGQNRLALMDQSGSQHERSLPCGGPKKSATVITTRRAPKTTQSPADHTVRQQQAMRINAKGTHIMGRAQAGTVDLSEAADRSYDTSHAFRRTVFIAIRDGVITDIERERIHAAAIADAEAGATLRRLVGAAVGVLRLIRAAAGVARVSPWVARVAREEAYDVTAILQFPTIEETFTPEAA